MMKILAVDDDEFILELIPVIASRAGFPGVTTVASGARALQAIATPNQQFDCFLLDIHMPGMDGIELCRRVRAMSAHRKTPILMLTAITEKSHIDSAFRAGATDYISKPFDITEIGARLRIAQELVLARNGLLEGRTQEAGSRASGKNRPDFKLSDAISIEDAQALVTYTALENYVAQLSRAGLAASEILAIKVDRIERIYAKASKDEFLYALREVTDAITEVFSSTGFMMAYAGSGVFVLVLNVALSPSGHETEAELQYFLDDRSSEYDDGSPLDIDVSVGSAVKSNISTMQQIRKTIDRAIARAESRVALKQNDCRRVNIRHIGK